MDPEKQYINFNSKTKAEIFDRVSFSIYSNNYAPETLDRQQGQNQIKTCLPT